MFAGQTQFDREKIDRMLQERIMALGVDPTALETEVGGEPLRALLCALIEETLQEAETENRELLRQRQQAGREAAAKQGISLGRPSKRCSDKRFAKMRGLYESREITAEEAAQRLHVSVSTFYRWLRESRQADHLDG